MRRTLLALTALASVLVVLATSGSGALAISSGPLQATPDPVPFGTEAQGLTTPAQTVTFQNTSGNAVTIDSPNGVQAGGDYNVTQDHCSGQVLNQNDTCDVSVTFQPTSNGTDNGQLQISDDDSSNPQQTVELDGTGVGSEFSLSGPLDFNDVVVGNSAGPVPETLTNNTDYPDNPTGPNVSGNSGDFTVDASACAGQIATTCTINVTFTPQSTGSRSATLSMGGQSVNLTGNGTQANAQVTPSSIGFGSQPVATDSGPSAITLKNTGTAPLTYGTITKGGADAGDFPVSDAGCQNVILNPGDSCTITADFVPTATGGRTATVTLHDDDPNSPTQTVTLTGNGTASSVGFSPASVTFVNTVVAGLASPVHSVTVTNTTSKNMPISSITIVGANPKNFIRSADTCSGHTLGPGASCTVHVEFAPTAAGARTALLQVTDTGPITPNTHVLTLTGRATNPNNPKSVRATVGCQSTQVSWVSPTATRFAGVRVVRNHAHYPANVLDGTLVPHSGRVATDKRLKHFTTYYYRVFATYHSTTRKSLINYSSGAKLKEHTGEVCAPQNGARSSDLSPKFTWLASPTRNGYAFVLQRGERTIDIAYTRKTSYQLASSWRWNKGRHRLLEGGTYTFFLYAYPRAHPHGILIGQTTFHERG